jgi:8-oxo-dGTP pyrophosphatase MutT (NUDIX family)
MSFNRPRQRVKYKEEKVGGVAINGDFQQNAAFVLSYEDSLGNICFLMGQNARWNNKKKKLELGYFRFPGGQVDRTDETSDIKLYKQKKKAGEQQTTPFITSVNQAGALRELKEETGVDIERINAFLPVNISPLKKHRITIPGSSSGKKSIGMNVSFYHAHLGVIGHDLENMLQFIIRESKKDDLHNVQFVKEQEIDKDFPIAKDNRKILDEISANLVAAATQAQVPSSALSPQGGLIQALQAYIAWQEGKEKRFLDWLFRRVPVEIRAAKTLMEIIKGNKTINVPLDELREFRSHPLRNIITSAGSEVPAQYVTRIGAVSSEAKSSKVGGAGAQAWEIWKQYIDPRLSQKKKVAFLYAANQGQADKLFKGYSKSLHGKALQEVFDGWGQSLLFNELAAYINTPQMASQVRVIPLATSLGGGNNSVGNHVSLAQMDLALSVTAWHLGNGFEVLGLGDQQGFKIGGGISGNWYKTNPIYLLKDLQGKYSLHIDEAKPLSKVLEKWLPPVGAALVVACLLIILLSLSIAPVGVFMAGVAAFVGLSFASTTIATFVGSSIFAVGLLAAAGATLGIGVWGRELLKNQRISQGAYMQEKLKMMSEQPVSSWSPDLQAAYEKGRKAASQQTVAPVSAISPANVASPQPAPTPAPQPANVPEKAPPADKQVTPISLFPMPKPPELVVQDSSPSDQPKPKPDSPGK